MSDTYSNDQRAEFAQAIFNAVRPVADVTGQSSAQEEQFHRMKAVLEYWGAFVPFGRRVMLAYEGEVAYIESLYDQLRPYAFEWFVSYQIGSLCSTLKDIVEIQKGMNAKTGEMNDAVQTLSEGLTHTLLDIQSRLEALEQPNGGRLGDHR